VTAHELDYDDRLYAGMCAVTDRAYSYWDALRATLEGSKLFWTALEGTHAQSFDS
jgi:hypothetical protein